MLDLRQRLQIQQVSWRLDQNRIFNIGKSREFMCKAGSIRSTLLNSSPRVLETPTKGSSGIGTLHPRSSCNPSRRTRTFAGTSPRNFRLSGMPLEIHDLSFLFLVWETSSRKKLSSGINNEQDENEMLIFSSSVPDKFYPVTKTAVRATNLFCILKLMPWRDGKTMYKSYAQADPNFYFNIFPIFKRFAGSKVKEWYESVTAHMDKFV